MRFHPNKEKSLWLHLCTSEFVQSKTTGFLGGQTKSQGCSGECLITSVALTASRGTQQCHDVWTAL